MSFASGSRLGSYEVVAPLGEGGMGEVYRARDTKLGRQVAIKVLLDAVAADRERIARFEREARMLAALNHPHIAALYGMEEADGRHFLVMELVEGETLAERLTHGAIRVDESLAIARQIVDALEAAHDRGIVHRDLKPANVKVAPDDRVKVLDFGLAKAMSDDSVAGATAGATHSPTLSMMATQAGIILGTAAYMSPEQAKGMPADHRSDIFSFGCVLYEMLTGRQPFHGETTPDVLASVLVREPDLTTLPPNLNPRLPELLKRCLEKQPRRRWQATGDLRAEIEAVSAAPRAASTHGGAPPQSLWRRLLPVAAGVVVASAVTGMVMWRLRPVVPAPVVSRFSIPLVEGRLFNNVTRNSLAISPDGTQIAYTSLSELYVRPLPEFATRKIGSFGETAVAMPAFSPDGSAIAFFSGLDTSIKRIPVAGGPAVTIVQSVPPFGLSWDESGVLFVDPNMGIMRAPSRGGKAELLVPKRQDEVLYGPEMLPDGQHVLFSQWLSSGPFDTAAIFVESVASHERKRVVETGSEARFLPTGHLVYALGGILFAVPFDLKRLEPSGTPTPVVEGVRRSVASTPAAFYSVSRNGTLIYAPGPASIAAGGMDVALLDRNGGISSLKLPGKPYEFPRVSPDGKQLAVQTDDGRQADIWVYDLSGASSLRRLTNGGRNRYPVWSDDSRHISFQSNREGDPGIFWQLADGSGLAERLTKADKDVEHIPESWSPDGKHLLFAKAEKPGKATLWTISVKDRTVSRFGDLQASESNLPSAAFSPDGQFVAYSGGQGGLFVQPFQSTGANKILVDQGIHPMWSADGKELLYRRRGQTFSVSVTTKPTFSFGRPTLVNLAGYRQRGPTVEREVDVTPDGKHFAVVLAAGFSEAVPQTQIQVVANWFEELKQRVPIPK